MRSLFKLSLASLAAVALFAGMALAQDKPTLSWSGGVGAGFGMYTYGETDSTTAKGKAYTEWNTAWESNIRGTINAGEQFTAVFRYRIRGFDGSAGNGTTSSTATSCTAATPPVCTGGSGTATGYSGASAYAAAGNDVYHEVHWKPIPALDIAMGKFQGQAWSNPLSGNYLIRNVFGDGEYWMNWTGAAGLDIEYNIGVVQVGLAIGSQCKPSCGPSAKSENQQSIVPHLTGKFGPIAVRAQLPSTSGVFNCTAVNTTGCDAADDQIAETGSGYQLGVQWGIPNISVAVDLSSFTEAAGDAKPEDRARSGTSLRVDAFGFMFHYWSAVDKNYSTVESTAQTMTLRYYIPVGGAQVIPEYRTDTTNSGATGADDITKSEFRLVGNVNF